MELEEEFRMWTAVKCYENDRINGMREEELIRINRRILLLNKVFTFKESVAQDAGDHSLQGKTGS